MIKCALLRQQRLGATPRVDPPALLMFAAGVRVKSVASEIRVHPWSASSSESRALLSDAEPRPTRTVRKTLLLLLQYRL